MWESAEGRDKAMKIAVATKGRTLEDLVPDTLEESPYLLIVETDDGSLEAFKNPEGQGGTGTAMAKEVLRHDCEAVICGTIEKDAFEVLSTAQVTRYMGSNLRASDALRLMDAYELDLIRVPRGEVYDPSRHNLGPSKCEGHED
jgi:predicted Fe-Mo cluster-binding NifX family protein